MRHNWDAVKRSLRQEKLLRQSAWGVRRFLLALAFLVGVECLLLLFVIGGAVISGNSMSPELHDGDIAVYNRLAHNVAPGDIVVVHSSANGRYYVKRVIAQAGAVVDLTQDGGVLVDGQRLSEPYVQRIPTMAQDLPFPQTVPPDHLFLLGDNRLVSRDSRNSAIGMIPLTDVKGELLFFFRAP